MGAISSYKKQFEEANKRLTEDQAKLMEVNEQMAALQKRKEQLNKQIAEDRQNKVVTGMLYYSENQRTNILDRADNLPYSKQAIARLRAYDKEHWNADNVDLNTIADFEAVEKYVNDHESPWDRSAFSKIGQIFNRNC